MVYGVQNMKRILPQCECNDPGCKGHEGVSECMAKGRIKVTRYDYETQGDHLLMCRACAEDALNSGIFS